MAKCEVCGNEYDKAFELIAAGARHTFDSFECDSVCRAGLHPLMRVVFVLAVLEQARDDNAGSNRSMNDGQKRQAVGCLALLLNHPPKNTAELS